MPCRFDDVTVDLGTFEGDAMPFMAEHYGGMFQKADASSRFLVEPMTESKLRFCQEMDTFVFRHEGRAVGLLIAHPSDWSSYYVRTAAILPDFRRRHLIVQYMHEIIPPLQRAGVARLETEVTPANIPMVAFHHDHGFMVTSTSTSDRWGMLLRFTRFLSDDAERTFVRQFCAMAVKPPKSETPNPRRTP
ncbi:MAG: GNAT family N-acetyltransferase [Deltaproteobacteria bacterium]|nr:GNAT family N-acetyltransferase [Deltaproteobacteria bacterium]